MRPEPCDVIRDNRAVAEPFWWNDGRLHGDCYACGYSGVLDDRGYLGLHCSGCGVKLLCQENRYV